MSSSVSSKCHSKASEVVGNLVGGTLCIRVGSPCPSNCTLDTSFSELTDNVFGYSLVDLESDDEVR